MSQDSQSGASPKGAAPKVEDPAGPWQLAWRVIEKFFTTLPGIASFLAGAVVTVAAIIAAIYYYPKLSNPRAWLNSRTVTYFGYYNNFNKENKPYTAMEQLTLTFLPLDEIQRVEGYSEGTAYNRTGEKESLRWELSGYKITGNMALSYYPPLKSGRDSSGVYYLKHDDNDQYVGTMIFKHDKDITHQSPYVLLTQKRDIEWVLRNYPELSKPCTKLFVPGTVAGNVPGTAP